MARQYKGILGGFKGGIGNVVGMIRNGDCVVRKKYTRGGSNINLIPVFKPIPILQLANVEYDDRRLVKTNGDRFVWSVALLENVNLYPWVSTSISNFQDGAEFIVYFGTTSSFGVAALPYVGFFSFNGRIYSMENNIWQILPYRTNDYVRYVCQFGVGEIRLLGERLTGEIDLLSTRMTDVQTASNMRYGINSNTGSYTIDGIAFKQIV